MISLLRFVTFPHVRQHRLRTALTVLGIALGVAVIVAISMVNRTLVTSFQRTIDLVAGKAVLQVANGQSGLRESQFPAIRDTKGVKDAAPIVEGVLPIAGLRGERLFVFGIDLLIDFFIRDYHFAGASFGFDAALDFIAQPDSIALTESLSRRLDLPVGSRLSLTTSTGIRSYTVRVLLKEEGAAKVFGGNFALMDLPVAQIALGKEGKIDLVDLTVEHGEDVETIQRRIQERLEGAAQVERPSDRGEQIESLLASFRIGLFFVSLIALFVGFFLIYNTVSISVVQRRREIGTLRCLGLVRRRLLGLFLSEALLLALPGSLAGVVAGVFLAEGAVAIVGETVSNLFFQADLHTTGPAARELWIALGSGLGVSLMAGLFPAWEATRVSPLESSRRAPWSPRSQGVFRASVMGLGLLIFSLLLWLYSPSEMGSVERFSLGVGAALVFLLALCFLSPILLLGSAQLSKDYLGRLTWIGGRLGLDQLVRTPVRSGITVATLMISMAAIFTIAAFIHSVRGSLISWIDQMVTADLVVSSGARTAGPMNVPLREALAERFEEIPGVRIVDLYRRVRSTYQGKPVLIESFSAAVSRQVRALPMARGERAEALKLMAEGRGVLVSESFEGRFGKSMGETIELPTPSGWAPIRIVGIYVDYSTDSGSILIDRALYKRLWRDSLVDAFDLWLHPDADEAAVIRKIRADYGAKFDLFVSTHRELKETVVGIMEQSFRVNYAVLIVAVVVAILGVINTLLASVLDRSRELGILRAIGATQGQILAMVEAEAGWMGLMGGVLGVMAGTVISYHHVVYNTKVLTGWTFQYHYPFGVAVYGLLLAVLVCLLAGFAPARKASSTSIASAVGYE